MGAFGFDSFFLPATPAKTSKSSHGGVGVLVKGHLGARLRAQYSKEGCGYVAVTLRVQGADLTLQVAEWRLLTEDSWTCGPAVGFGAQLSRGQRTRWKRCPGLSQECHGSLSSFTIIPFCRHPAKRTSRPALLASEGRDSPKATQEHCPKAETT